MDINSVALCEKLCDLCGKINNVTTETTEKPQSYTEKSQI